MTIDALVRTLHARGRHPKWRAKCPAHKSRGLTLAIYADKDGIGVHCHAGCRKDDVLAALGLTWRDLRPEREWMSTEAFRAAQRKREAEEQRARDIRVGQWCIRFIRNGYTKEDEDSDIGVVLACWLVLAVKSMPQWERLLRTHLERIEAAEHCMSRGMLPKEAQPRWSLGEVDCYVVPKVRMT